MTAQPPFVSDSHEGHSLRQRYRRRIGQMKVRREEFRPHWREISQYIQPRRGRYHITDVNKGGKRHQSIINSHATLALRRATAGFIAGTMSPTRPFFRLGLPQDPDLAQFPPVKAWFQFAAKQVMRVLNTSNFYSVLNPTVAELMMFGTGCMFQDNDFENVSHFYQWPVGSFVMAQNGRNNVDTFAREYQMTVEQLVTTFGYENCSLQTRTNFDRGNYDHWVPVTHFLGPNRDFDANKLASGFLPWSSDYWEMDTTGNQNAASSSTEGTNNTETHSFLRKSGFEELRVYAPRWGVTGEDIYGTDCPGMTALGDVKQLQVMEIRKSQAVDKMVSPPLKGPGSLKNVRVSSKPSGITLYDADGTREGLQPLYEVNFPVQEIRLDIAAMERRISELFYVDLFLAITEMDGIQPRNELELTNRNQERLVQLGPALTQFHTELAGPVVENTLARLSRVGALPPPPEEIQGMDMDITYISPLAQAQRAVEASQIERTGAFVGSLAQLFPSVLDKYDADQAVDEYAEIIGSPASVVRSDEDVAQIRADRERQQRMERQLAMAQQAATVAQTAASAPTDQENLLTDINKAMQEARGNA